MSFVWHVSNWYARRWYFNPFPNSSLYSRGPILKINYLLSWPSDTYKKVSQSKKNCPTTFIHFVGNFHLLYCPQTRALNLQSLSKYKRNPCATKIKYIYSFVVDDKTCSIILKNLQRNQFNYSRFCLVFSLTVIILSF